MNYSKTQKPDKLYVAHMGGYQWHGKDGVLYGSPSYDQCEMAVLQYQDIYKAIGVFVPSEEGIPILGYEGLWDLEKMIEVPPDTLKSPGIPQGPGSIVKGLHFWRRDNKFYWEDGSITEVPHAAEGRIMLTDPNSCHSRDFSKWSEKTRAKVKARWDAERKAREEAEEEEKRVRLELMEEAKSKLTEAEFDAIYNTGYYDGRGF